MKFQKLFYRNRSEIRHQELIIPLNCVHGALLTTEEIQER